MDELPNDMLVEIASQLDLKSVSIWIQLAKKYRKFITRLNFSAMQKFRLVPLEWIVGLKQLLYVPNNIVIDITTTTTGSFVMVENLPKLQEVNLYHSSRWGIPIALFTHMEYLPSILRFLTGTNIYIIQNKIFRGPFNMHHIMPTILSRKWPDLICDPTFTPQNIEVDEMYKYKI